VTTSTYYADDTVTLWHGDMRTILPGLDLAVDAIVADPPYGETSLIWDRWPDGWLSVARAASASLWCFGSMRMFGERWSEFGAAGWKLSQDIIGDTDVEVVWEKHNGSGFAKDRFKRVHENATHWYGGTWGDVHHDTPTTPDAVARQARSKGRPAHMGDRKANTYTSEDGGPRLTRSVIKVRNMHGRAIHPTEKPVALLEPMLHYAVPVGGLVLDPFAGSGSTAEAARLGGRRAVLIEADEKYCEAIARRMSQGVLTGASE
jgi:site-specific DNA-methyltransferase (adenine-specific)